MDPNWPASVAELPEVEAAARSIGRKLVVVKASSEREFEAAFAALVAARAGALVVSGTPYLTSQSRQLVALAARHSLPAIYDVRHHAAAGGLISYAGSNSDAYRQAGIYAGRILKGAKPSELPVMQSSTFELVINMKTARALGLKIPQSLMLRANELIQ
jgi:putative ABC transport system substrate-binding protein